MNQVLNNYLIVIPVESNPIIISPWKIVGTSNRFIVPDGYKTVTCIPRTTSNSVWT